MTTQTANQPSKTGNELQAEIERWCQECFGDEKTYNIVERCNRVIEETTELMQSLGIPEEAMISQVRHVYSRPVGEPSQELAGTQVCLFALAAALKIKLFPVTEEEVARIWQNIPKIREKNLLKPTFV